MCFFTNCELLQCCIRITFLLSFPEGKETFNCTIDATVMINMCSFLRHWAIHCAWVYAGNNISIRYMISAEVTKDYSLRLLNQLAMVVHRPFVSFIERVLTTWAIASAGVYTAPTRHFGSWTQKQIMALCFCENERIMQHSVWRVYEFLSVIMHRQFFIFYIRMCNIPVHMVWCGSRLMQFSPLSHQKILHEALVSLQADLSHQSRHCQISPEIKVWTHQHDIDLQSEITFLDDRTIIWIPAVYGWHYRRFWNTPDFLKVLA